MRRTLTYFTPEEFGDWYDQLNPELLQKLDAFRAAWGAPVVVSDANGAIGRTGQGDHSQHNVEVWGEVRAIDVFPKVEIEPGVYGWMQTGEERARAYRLAKEIGFTGIGLYTDTAPGNMLHLDVRRDRLSGNPAKWSRISGEYMGINEVLA
ncbi:hypothetical protein [Marinimicrobium sp. C2-29]|uniref:hypothetical protein n=1 Tax=Marinimicrobium sp. C2-29 TaxID=3139825 RepID=UPI00313A3033